MAIIKNKFAGKIEAGKNNTSSGDYSSAIAGQNNCATGVYSSVAGGCGNQAIGYGSVVGGGIFNRVIGTEIGGVIVGGVNNCLVLGTGGGGYGVIVGGQNNFNCSYNGNSRHNVIVGGLGNRTTGSYEFIGAGSGNTVNSYNGGTIVGGQSNTISSDQHGFIGAGNSNIVSNRYSTVIHGYNNTASGYNSGIAMGRLNQSIGKCSYILSGLSNITCGSFSTVGGGHYNRAVGINSVVFGGGTNCCTSTLLGNCATGDWSSILGGAANCATSIYSSVVGGCANKATGYGSFVGGGLGNIACCNADPNLSSNYSVISGGQYNCTLNPNSFIGSGFCNRITSTRARGMVIGGGCCNVLTQNDQNQHPMVIAGGQCNCIGGAGGVISGGTLNVGGGYNINHTTIAGGNINTASVAGSTIIGGSCNSASGACSTVLGGNQNIASGGISIAGGYYNRASSSSSIALGCGGCTSFPSQFAVGAENHVSGLLFEAGLFQSSSLLVFNKAINSVENFFTSGQEVTLYPGDSSSVLLKPGRNKAWHVTVKYTMVVGAISGTVDGINVGDCLFGSAEFGYRNGTNGFITSTIRDNKVTNNSALDTGTFTFTYGASQEIVSKMIVPEFTGGGSLRIRANIKFELVETIQG